MFVYRGAGGARANMTFVHIMFMHMHVHMQRVSRLCACARSTLTKSLMSTLRPTRALVGGRMPRGAKETRPRGAGARGSGHQAAPV